MNNSAMSSMPMAMTVNAAATAPGPRQMNRPIRPLVRSTTPVMIASTCDW